MRFKGFRLEWETEAGLTLGIETLEDGTPVYGKWAGPADAEEVPMVPTVAEAQFLVASGAELVKHMTAWIAPKARTVDVEVLSAAPNALPTAVESPTLGDPE